MKPKIVQINSTANMGSTGRIAEQIGIEIKNEGWDSIIAYGRDANVSKSQLFRIESKFGVNIHGIYSMLFDRHGEASIFATKKLIRFLEEEKPNIIHLHNLHGYYLNYPILFDYLKNSESKVVWTLHDCWAFTGHCSYFSDIGCDKWKLECNSCPKKGNYPKSIFFDNSKRNYYIKRAIFNSVDIHFVTVSNWLKGLVETSFIGNQTIETIWNGVDAEVFIIQEKDTSLLEKYNIKGKTILLAASTSWAKQKGFDDYLKLSNLLSPNEVIVLVGLSDNLKAILPNNIIGVERTENIKQLAKWYATSDIVLNLSYQETFGLTSVEGFMCGKPTLVYNATASPELVVDNIMGEIIEPGNIEEVYQATKRIELRRYDAKEIRDVSVKKFGASTQYKKYIKLYKSLLNY